MPFLIQCNEWRLLQRLARALSHKKAPCWLEQRDDRDQKHPQDTSVPHPNLELLEIELRQLLTVAEYPHNVEDSKFNYCYERFISICSLLDRLAGPSSTNPFIVSNNTHGYVHLENSIDRAQKSTGPIDLVQGPNKKLFISPSNVELTACLGIVTQCNELLSGLVQPLDHKQPINSNQSTRQKRDKKDWKTSRMRKRARFVLDSLFQRLRCQTSHEILLKLIEDGTVDSVLPELQMMLSLCPELAVWQDIRCEADPLKEQFISPIPDLCADLRQHAGRGKTLTLLVENYELFGTWKNEECNCNQQTRQTLAQLIDKGAFKPIDFDILSPAKFNVREKRALAVKLGFCLMDFFDFDVVSTKLHLQESEPETNSLFLAFDSRATAATISHKFQIGHPNLLSFAKLLLELEFGSLIDVEIQSQSSKNTSVWAMFLERVERLQLDRNDVYFDAIRSCLLIHQEITIALASKDDDGSSPDAIVREILYRGIVEKLEQALADATPRSIRKRQRSESPPLAIGGYQQRATTKRHNLGFQSISSSLRNDSSTMSPPSNHSALDSKSSLPDLQQNPVFNNQPSTLSHNTLSLPQLPSNQPLSRGDFHVGIICALSLEIDAITYHLDSIWDETGVYYARAPGDANLTYTTGCMGGHNVVVAQLPRMGKSNGASTAAYMKSSFPKLRIAFLVGVCGAVPQSGGTEILLGDVIISNLAVQTDFGRQYDHKFAVKDTVKDALSRPSKEIQNLINIFETDRGITWLEARLSHHLGLLQQKVDRTRRYKGKYRYPGIEKDTLYDPNYRHKHHKSAGCCECANCCNTSDPVCDQALHAMCDTLGCDDKHLVKRHRIEEIENQLKQLNGCMDLSTTQSPPMAHVGAFATCDSVVKSASRRDIMANDFDIIAFEMEGAGIWDEIPTIIVKGACDYADSHKNKMWQNYAAGTAASACKSILERLSLPGRLSADG